jgi:colanic acid biosynthesis glycosyl transferase WcaI
MMRADASLAWVTSARRRPVPFRARCTSLRPELDGLVVPSKFYGIAAAGRPMIAITAADGEMARLVRRHECGIVIKPGDAQALAAALVSSSGDVECVAAMGPRARQMLDALFTRRQALACWQHLLDHTE